jgi:uncharacterized OsmC-like protein
MDERNVEASPIERIRTAFERSAQAIRLRPSIGAHTAVSRVVVQQGVRCEIEEGRWKLVSDLSEKAGGGGDGPDPGVLGRAAFGSCLAMAYVQWFAHLGVPLDRLAIEVQADFDAGAQYGVGDSPPGYTEVRYHVAVVSGAPAAEVERALDEAEKHCPYWDVFARPQALRRTFDVSPPIE